MIEVIVEQVKSILSQDGQEVDPSSINAKTPLIGQTLDSMNIVNLCLSLEEIAEDEGFEFDWTSKTAMSKSRSMFRSIETLSEEFLSQKEKK